MCRNRSLTLNDFEQLRFGRILILTALASARVPAGRWRRSRRKAAAGFVVVAVGRRVEGERFADHISSADARVHLFERLVKGFLSLQIHNGIQILQRQVIVAHVGRVDMRHVVYV